MENEFKFKSFLNKILPLLKWINPDNPETKQIFVVRKISLSKIDKIVFKSIFSKGFESKISFGE
jgi:hypothetical protein